MSCRCGEPVLTPRELSRQERAWAKRLEAVLLDAPPGIGLLTMGDACLTIYDAKAADEHGITHLADGGAQAHGIVLGNVKSAVNIEGVSG